MTTYDDAMRKAREALEPRVPIAVCQTCGETVYPDVSYASGYRHAYPGALHGANVTAIAWDVRR